MKHTPGPWETVPLYDDPLNEAENENMRIEEAGGVHRGICRVWYPGFVTEEDRANARLIAAAPEMFEALQLVQPFCILRGSANIDDEQWRDVMDTVERVIAKATGKTKGDE